MFELPPPPSVEEEDPRVRERRVAESLGEALEIQPYTWEGELTAGDRVALLSRNVAQVVGVDEVQRALATLRPAAAVEHLHQLFQIRGGQGSDGLMAIELIELAPTTATHHLEPVHPNEELAGLPDRSPVPLADAIGHLLHRGADAIDATQRGVARALLVGVNMALAFVPRRRALYPTSIPRTALREAGRRRRRGLIGIGAVAALLAIGASVASLPNPRPTDAILRASIARAAIGDALNLLGTVEERVNGRDLVDRDPTRAAGLLADAQAAVKRADEAGVAYRLARPAARSDRARPRHDLRGRTPDAEQHGRRPRLGLHCRGPDRHGDGRRRLVVGRRGRSRAGHPGRCDDRRGRGGVSRRAEAGGRDGGRSMDDAPLRRPMSCSSIATDRRGASTSSSGCPTGWGCRGSAQSPRRAGSCRHSSIAHRWRSSTCTSWTRSAARC